MKIFLRFFVLPLVAVGSLLSLWACSDDFLEVAPTGSLNQEVLATLNGVDLLLVGAYAQLNGRGSWYGGSTNWVHGSIQGGDANKGTTDGDQAVLNDIIRYQLNPTNGPVSNRWNEMFEGVSRANAALNVIRIGIEQENPRIVAEAGRLEGEARFLRGHYYFNLKVSYNQAPFIEAGTSVEEVVTIPSTPDIWSNIEEDFRFGYENLPETQTEVGRANRWAAGAYLGKTLLFQGRWEEARTVLNDVFENGQTSGGQSYALLDDYAQLFNAEFDNNSESVFAIQSAVNTESTNTANPDLVLAYPHNTGSTGPGGCCGFYQPSFDLANSYRTENGLPLSGTSYRDEGNALNTDFGLAATDPFTTDTKPVDPRLDHTVGRRGIPYLRWGAHPGRAWIRDQSYAGPYSPKKHVYYATQEGSFSHEGGWTRGYSAVNWNIIRFADVILMLAEAEIETGDLERGRELINLVRARAANPATLTEISNPDGSTVVPYEISQYTSSFGSQQAARNALYMERKLELAMEGHRFFDLVRWGLAENFLNGYIDYERQFLPVQFSGAAFTAPQDLYYPIPQSEIDLQGTDVLGQNPGY